VGEWKEGGRQVVSEDGTVDHAWWPTALAPSCTQFSQEGRGALGEWDRGVCQLFSAAFAHPPVAGMK
jgi:hypothetical protein